MAVLIGGLILIAFALLFCDTAFCDDKRALVVISNKFRDEEFKASYEAVKEAGYNPVIVSIRKEELRGTEGMLLDADLLISEINPADYEAVIFVGGVGASALWNDVCAHNIIRHLYEHGKLVAGICIGAVTLAKAGILKGKRATCWYVVADEMVKEGALYVKEPVVVEGNIITACGLDALKPFKETLIAKLKQKR